MKKVPCKRTIQLIMEVGGKRKVWVFHSADATKKEAEEWDRGINRKIISMTMKEGHTYLMSAYTPHHPDVVNNKLYCPFSGRCHKGPKCKRMMPKEIMEIAKSNPERVAMFYTRPNCFIKRLKG